MIEQYRHIAAGVIGHVVGVRGERVALQILPAVYHGQAADGRLVVCFAQYLKRV